MWNKKEQEQKTGMKEKKIGEEENGVWERNGERQRLIGNKKQQERKDRRGREWCRGRKGEIKMGTE